MFEQYGDVLTVRELCEMLRISRNLAYDLLNSGAVRSIRVGRVHRIPKQSVIQYLAQPEPSNPRRTETGACNLIRAVNGKEEP
ncbi:MAG: helix-turn-helix domain-containing protein [Clostridiales bacterium]|nr:helix-turn-helix domain-containing protein [Clostridiales bacterium]